MWTAYDGHHTWRLIDDKYYKFSENGNPYAYWEHLCLHSLSSAHECLRSKNIPESHITLLLGDLFTSDFVSRITPSDILATFHEVDKNIIYKRGYTDVEKNIFFEIAKKEIRETDLMTRYIHIIMKG